VGRSVSSFGDSALYLSLGIWAKQLTGSNAAAGEVFLAMGLACVCAPVAGQFADRLDRRRLLIASNALTGLVVLSLLAVHDRDQLWIMYAVAVVYGVSGTVSAAATAGVFRDLLADADLPAANASLQTVGQGLRLISPAVGAGLFVWLGGSGLAILDASTFVVLILTLASRPPTNDRRSGPTTADLEWAAGRRGSSAPSPGAGAAHRRHLDRDAGPRVLRVGHLRGHRRHPSPALVLRRADERAGRGLDRRRTGCNLADGPAG
jgi:MFS family permease